MNTGFDTGADPPAADATTNHDARSEHPAFLLRSTTVAYEDGPDRRTVSPWGASGVTLMSTWLTADASAFVDLIEVR